MTINVFGGGYNPLAPVFPVQRSVRFRSSASAYFARTPASAGNRQIFTFSWWVKRGALSAAQEMYFCNSGAGNFSQLSWAATNTITIASVDSSVAQCELITTAVYRDPSAWYHVMFAVDTTQATASNRVKIYVNGVQVTVFNTATYPALNYNFQLNNTTAQNIGRPSTGTLDGYLTEFYFIDGQALTPSSFGSYNAGSGVWQPTRYSGTYGTNGFYLNFQDNSAATAAAIGKDSSGNGNNWTPNNISVTAGVTYDSMVDVPTLTSPTNANFATLNPLPNISSPAPTYTNANLSGSVTGSASTYSQIIGTQSVSSGKWYVEITATSANRLVIGFSQPNGLSTTVGGGSSGVNYVAYRSDTGNKYINAALTAYGATFTNNDIIGIALDLDNLQCTFYKNNVSQGLITGLTAGEYTINARSGDSTAVAATFNANFGQRPFTYTPPTGFKSLNTYNLPTPTIPNGATQMAATLYTGNGAAQTISNTVNGVSFQPDWIWAKPRSVANYHAVWDSVRGSNNLLYPNDTLANDAVTNLNMSVNSSGWSMNGANSSFNPSGATIVGWQWKASNATAVTNTSGSISSQVSANTTAGFSVVTWTGVGSTGTIGHGLGVAPKFIITKYRNAVNAWLCYHVSLGAGSRIYLNQTDASGASATVWNNTSPTSSVFSVGDANTNASGGTYVAYAFAEIAGYSKFGSYTGNGSTDGPFVYTSMRPRWVMIKRTDTTGDWVIWDTSRNTYNAAQNGLYPNLSVAEGNSYFIDVLSNGFKLRMSTIMNVSSGTYIYACFAENPFTYSLAR
jgi:hypothetical protein